MGKPSNMSILFEKSRLLVLLLLLLLSFVKSQQNIELEIDRYFNYTLSEGQYKYFQVTIRNTDFSGSQDLIVQVLPFRDNDDPDLFISKTNKKPTSVENSDYVCSSYGKDTCSVPKSEIGFNDVFYIGVRCKEECRFFIKASVQDQIFLSQGVELQLYFEKQETKLFSYYVPQYIEGKSPVESITIIAAPFLPTQNELTLSVSIDNQSLPTSSESKGVPAWTKGQVILLTSDDDKTKWCTGCYLTVMVDAADEGRYYIMARTNMARPRLYDGKKVDDAIYFNHTQCYQYYVKSPKSDVKIIHQMFSGMVVFSINPQGKENINYTMNSMRSSVLTIAPWTRAGNLTGWYDICLRAVLTSSYSIIVTEESHQDYSLIDDGFNLNDELRGNDTKFYMYKVPPLIFTTEDIALEFSVQGMSGSVPHLGVAYCKTPDDLQRCYNDALNIVKYGTGKSPFMFGQTVTPNMKALHYDHNEEECRNVYNSQCYYVILISGTSNNTNDISYYTVSVYHEQLNHILLMEKQPQSDYIDPNEHPYKHYKFQLVEKPINIQSVTFKLNTLHGDTDLFVSKSLQFPNKEKFDKSSQLSKGTDTVVFDYDIDGAETLKGSFYIGVFGWQYSTYTLTAIVQRKNQFVDLIHLSAEELIEGVPVLDGIYSIYGERLYQIKVNMIQGYEKNINIQLTALEGQFNLYASWDAKPNETNYDYSSEGTNLKIRSTDPSYELQGTLFIVVKPHYTFLNMLLKNIKYRFTIVYTSKDQFTYLQSKLPQSVHAWKKEIKYFRHFVSKADTDISISLTIQSGNPHMFVSIDPKKTLWPDKQNNDYSTLNNNVSMAQGKQLLIKSFTLKNANPACRDGGLTALEPCGVYISVHCPGQSDCAYSLSVMYENGEPQLLAVGHPTYGEVREGNYIYYYSVIAKGNEVKDIYAVLTTLSGNTDLYFSFQDRIETYEIKNLVMPNKNRHQKSSDELLTADVITITKEDIEDNCFIEKSSTECGLIFGVYGYTNKGNFDALDAESFKYSFVVYQDLISLYSNSPQTNWVEQGQYQYYLFHANCDTCSLLIAASTYSNGDPDLYINYGDSRLPTMQDHDISRTTFKSEIVELNMNNMDFFRSKNIKSMRGPYIIGIYGKTDTTYTISVSAETQPMALLSEGLSLKKSQVEYEVSYFQYYNWQEKDIKISIDVKQGVVDIYVSTYDDDNKEMNLVERLPKSKKNAQWVLDNVTPMSSTYEKELLIVKDDRLYCTRCVYLVGVVTHEKQADYSIMLSGIYADYKNSQIIKLGETYRGHLNGQQRAKMFKFMVDELADLSVTFQVLRGTAEMTLGFSEQLGSHIHQLSQSGTFVLTRNDEKLKTKKMYYLFVNQKEAMTTAIEDTEFSIFITQKKSIIHLQDGVPQLLVFDNKEDITKHMTIGVPRGDTLVMFQLKTKTDNFYPKLYYQFFDDINEQMRKGNITFPPNGSPGFQSYKKWDPKLNIMTVHVYKDKVQTSGAGFAITLFDSQMERKQNERAEVLLTVSYSAEQRLMMKNTQMGSLFHDKSFRLYKIDHSDLQGKGSLLVEYSDCLGKSDVKFVEGPDYMNATIQRFQQQTNEIYGKKNIYMPLPRNQSLYVMVSATDTLKEYNRSDFLIKAQVTNMKFIKSDEFILPDQGQLLYKFEDSNSFNLTWKEPKSAVPSDKPASPISIKYHVLITKNKQANLDTICALRREIIDLFGYTDFASDQPNYFFKNGEPGQSYLLNVIAEVKANEKDEGELLAYRPIEITIPKSNSVISNIAFWLYIIAAVGLSGAACYYYKESKETKTQLEFEMADVRNVASVYSSSQKSEMQQKQREERFQRLTTGEEDEGEQLRLRQ